MQLYQINRQVRLHVNKTYKASMARKRFQTDTYYDAQTYAKIEYMAVLHKSFVGYALKI